MLHRKFTAGVGIGLLAVMAALTSPSQALSVVQMQSVKPSFQNVVFRECHRGCVDNKCGVLICNTDLGCINCKKKKAAITSQGGTNPSKTDSSTNKKNE